MLCSRQSNAANFMDIGRISAAIKRKVIELVENGLCKRTGRPTLRVALQKNKNATEAAFIALVVYIFSLYIFFFSIWLLKHRTYRKWLPTANCRLPCLPSGRLGAGFSVHSLCGGAQPHRHSLKTWCSPLLCLAKVLTLPFYLLIKAWQVCCLPNAFNYIFSLAKSQMRELPTGDCLLNSQWLFNDIDICI